ncbi:MAG: hypothetical protein Q4B28_05075 [bacterium]|nr:hypothetical protein [bacterium]
MVGSYIPKAVNADDEMSALLIPSEYESLLWAGMSYWIYKHKKQYNEANYAKQEYEEEKMKFKLTSGEEQKVYYAHDLDLSDFE